MPWTKVKKLVWVVFYDNPMVEFMRWWCSVLHTWPWDYLKKYCDRLRLDSSTGCLDMHNLIQSLSHVQLFATPRTAACQASPSITNSQSLLKFMSIESVMPSKHLILCHPLLLPSIFPIIRVFSQRVSCSHQVAKVLELVSTSVLPKSIQGWFPLGLTGLISLLSTELSRVFSSWTYSRRDK